MKSLLQYFIHPVKFMELLYKKPEIIFPTILASLIPLFSYNTVLATFESTETKFIVLILIMISFFSVLFFFMTAFIIYLLLSIILNESDLTFSKVYSIYGYTQFPKFLLALLLLFFPPYESLTVSAATNFTEAIFNFITNPLMLWKYVLLVCGFFVITKLKMRNVIIAAVFFAVLEVSISFFISDFIKF